MEQIEDIRWIELLSICQYIGHSSGNAEFIRLRSEPYSHNFNANITFLEELNLVKNVSGSYALNFSVAELENKKSFKQFLARALLCAPSVYSDVLTMFFAKFQRENGVWSCRISASERRQFSGIRNLLLELDILQEYREQGAYLLNAAYTECIVCDAVLGRSFDLENELRKQKEIGSMAELMVLEYERKRISALPIRELNVIHVAAYNDAAGYDIKSWTSEGEGRYLPRYIEVKAVSLFGQRFYWTRNEVEKAKILADQYFLYLVPVDADVGLNIDHLITIQNPHPKVFSGSKWTAEAEVLCVTART